MVYLTTHVNNTFLDKYYNETVQMSRCNYVCNILDTLCIRRRREILGKQEMFSMKYRHVMCGLAVDERKTPWLSLLEFGQSPEE